MIYCNKFFIGKNKRANNSRFLRVTATRSVAFVGRSASAAVGKTHSAGCICPACVSVHPSGCACAACGRGTHPASCACTACAGRVGTALFADATETEAAETEATETEAAETEAVVAEVPAEVEALDGVESEEEAHNVERPARKNLQKKKKGKDLSEFEAGSTVSGTIKSITNYGAFVDIGASTDGLLHISQLASGFVASVGDIVSEGQAVEVRIVSIDSDKGQIALSLISEEEEAAGKASQKRDRPQRQNRRDDSAVLASLSEKGWDSDAFIAGTVVSTVDFGCFVRIDSKVLNSECEGDLDGLVHISALRSGRVNSVTDVVRPEDKVQVRVKTIEGNKVSLTMLSVDEEKAKSEERGNRGGGAAEFQGAKDWKESLAKFEEAQPSFKNGIKGP